MLHRFSVSPEPIHKPLPARIPPSVGAEVGYTGLMTTLIGEDVLVMLLDDRGAFLSNDSRKPALAGAVLAELALTGAVEIESEKGLWKRAKVVIRDRGAVTDPLLVGAL